MPRRVKVRRYEHPEDPRETWLERADMLDSNTRFENFYAHCVGTDIETCYDKAIPYLTIATFYDLLFDYGLPTPNTIEERRKWDRCRDEYVIQKVTMTWAPNTLRQEGTSIAFGNVMYDMFRDQPGLLSDCKLAFTMDTSLPLETPIGEAIDGADPKACAVVHDATLQIGNPFSSGWRKFTNAQDMAHVDIRLIFAFFCHYYHLNPVPRAIERLPNATDATAEHDVFFHSYKRIRIPQCYDGISFQVGTMDGPLEEYLFVICCEYQCSCAGRYFLLDATQSTLKHPNLLIGKVLKSFDWFHPDVPPAKDKASVRILCCDGHYMTFDVMSDHGSNNHTATCILKNQNGMESAVV